MTRRGTASIEAAVALAFVIMPLCLASADLALAVTTANRIDRALQAALFYIWANPGTATASAAQAAAAASWGSGTPALTVGVTTSCACVNGGYLSAGSTACGGSCPAGETLAAYTTVTATASVTLPFPVPGLPSPYAPSVTATIRTQ